MIKTFVLINSVLNISTKSYFWSYNAFILIIL